MVRQVTSLANPLVFHFNPEQVTEREAALLPGRVDPHPIFRGEGSPQAQHHEHECLASAQHRTSGQHLQQGTQEEGTL